MKGYGQFQNQPIGPPPPYSNLTHEPADVPTVQYPQQDQTFPPTAYPQATITIGQPYLVSERGLGFWCCFYSPMWIFLMIMLIGIVLLINAQAAWFNQ